MQKEEGEKGAITALLLPGLDGTGLLFDRFVREAPEAFVPYVVDYPGTAAQTYDALTDWVAERLPADAPFVLVAESFSGPIAVRLAATHPERLRALVLAASFARAPTPFGIAESLARLALTLPGNAHVATLALLGTRASRAQRNEVIRVIKQVRASTLAARVHAVSHVDVRESLARVAVPVLYLRATRDRLVTRRHAHDVREIAPNGTCVDIEAPHLVLQSAPAACWQALGRFVQALPNPR